MGGSSCPALGFFAFTTGSCDSIYSIDNEQQCCQFSKSNALLIHEKWSTTNRPCKLTASSDFRFEGCKLVNGTTLLSGSFFKPMG